MLDAATLDKVCKNCISKFSYANGGNEGFGGQVTADVGHRSKAVSRRKRGRPKKKPVQKIPVVLPHPRMFQPGWKPT